MKLNPEITDSLTLKFAELAREKNRKGEKIISLGLGEPLFSTPKIIVEETIKENPVEKNLIYQNAPLVGTFYISPKPGEPPFIEVGQKVAKGQTLCIIEAMKIFNEIESEYDGEIVEILINDSSPVEFNQPIFSIRNN